MKLKAPSLVVAGSLLALSLLAAEPSRVAPKDAPSFASVAPADEPGSRLEVSGVVYAADGKTPVASASLYVYQTDARGFYRPDDAMGNRNPRLMALLRTDAQGRYSYRTIRPGSYPSTRVPQHIHYEVTAEGQGTRIFEIVFDDDPFMNEKTREDAAKPGSIYALQRVSPATGGASRIIQDVVLARP